MIDSGRDPREPAIADAELVRYLDGELTDTERAAFERRLRNDDAAAARLHTLQRRSTHFREILQRTDPPATVPPADRADPRTALPQRPALRDTETNAVRDPRGSSGMHASRWTRRSSVPLLRAAVLVLAVIGAALIVPPVRAWILEDLLGSARDVRAPAAPVVGSDTTAALRYGLLLDGERFTIDVARMQREGVLILRWADDAPRAELIGEPAGTELLVLPGTLRIVNGEDVAASYRVTLPAAVSAVTVRIGGTERVLRREDSGPEVRLSLREAAR